MYNSRYCLSIKDLDLFLVFLNANGGALINTIEYKGGLLVVYNEK